MTPSQFRRLALALPGVEERAHMGHPDFRVGGRIFATLGSPEPGWAMVRVRPEDQVHLLRAHPAACQRAAGAWGEAGCTLVLLKAVRVASIREALEFAWEAASRRGATRTRRARPGASSPPSARSDPGPQRRR